MRLTHLSLSNFRGYIQLDLDLPSGPMLLRGGNAQGKSSVLEAIYYLATSKSPHVSSDRHLINWQARDDASPITVSRLVAQVESNTSAPPTKIEIRLILEHNGNGTNYRREVLINNVKVRFMELLGHLNVILFQPEDVALITESPSVRRRYLDITLCQVDGVYCRSLSRYNRVLQQRNALLKSLQERRAQRNELDHWDESLAELGGKIFHDRANAIIELGRTASKIHYDQLTNTGESLRLSYQPRFGLRSNNKTPHNASSSASFPSFVSDWEHLTETSPEEISSYLLQTYRDLREKDVQRGSTQVGPHRDDLQFLVNGRDLAAYGSRGQQRSCILALKLAEAEWMKARTGESPVMLLDEVLAELDHERRSMLQDAILKLDQAVLTATDVSMFMSSFLNVCHQYEVKGGSIAPVSSPDM